MIPAGVRHAVAAGPEALRQRTPQPCHELRPRRRAGPVRRVECHPQAVVPHRIQLPHRAGLLSDVDARLVRRGQSAGPEVGDVVRPRLPHDPLPRRGCLGREALRLQAEPAAEGDAGVPGPGRRDPRLLLCQRRAAQGPAERRDPPLRRVLEAADRPPARGTDLRLQADDLRQPQQVEPDGDPVHHAAAPVPEAARRDRPDSGVGLATDRTGERLPRVQDAARPGPADHAERITTARSAS